MAVVKRATNHFRVVNEITKYQFDVPSLWHVADRFMIKLPIIRRYFTNEESFNIGCKIYRIPDSEIALLKNKEYEDDEYEEESEEEEYEEEEYEEEEYEEVSEYDEYEEDE